MVVTPQRDLITSEIPELTSKTFKPEEYPRIKLKIKIIPLKIKILTIYIKRIGIGKRIYQYLWLKKKKITVRVC